VGADVIEQVWKERQRNRTAASAAQSTAMQPGAVSGGNGGKSGGVDLGAGKMASTVS
jgi:hypothetical protein